MAPTVVDLFCGAGGFSCGFARAGFDVVAAVDTNAHACATLAANHRGANVVCAAVDSDAARATFARVGVGTCDVVVGGPPCQPFSQARKRDAAGAAIATTAVRRHGGRDPWFDDARNGVPAYFAAVQRLRPRAFVMENVRPLQRYVASHIEPEFLAPLRERYDIYMRALDAQRYGVPQHRERFFIVGVPRGAPFAWPTECDGAPLAVRSALAPTLEPIGAPTSAAIRYCRTPVLNRTLQTSYVVNGAGRPLDLERPSPTITASTGGAHTHIVDANGVLQAYYDALRGGTASARTGRVVDARIRRLTAREMARIQMFADDYEFCGPPTAVCRQIGNAVPPKMAFCIAQCVRAALEHNATPKDDAQCDTSIEYSV